MPQHKLTQIPSLLYYLWLPKSLRKFISPIVSPPILFIKRIKSVVSQIRSPVILLQGKEKCGGSSLTTLFVGMEWMVPYLSDLLYSKQPNEKRLGKIFIWETKSKLDSRVPEADLVFLGVDRFFLKFLSNRGFFTLPEWVFFTRSTKKPIPKISRSSKNRRLVGDLRKIRKYNYSYEITHDPEKFSYFYHHMYLPYVRKRFEDLTLHTSFEKMKKTFENGHLLLVKRENEYLAASLNAVGAESVFPHYVGVKDGKTDYVKHGALGATYYFTILWAQEKGFKRVDFGHCRPFLNDGVFRYKKKWGMEIEGERSRCVKNIFGLKVCNVSQGVLDFLVNNPFIFIDQGKLKSLILTRQENPLSLEEVESLEKNHFIPELDALIIISPKGFTKEAEDYATSLPNQKLDLVSMDPEKFFKK